MVLVDLGISHGRNGMRIIKQWFVRLLLLMGKEHMVWHYHSPDPIGSFMSTEDNADVTLAASPRW